MDRYTDAGYLPLLVTTLDHTLVVVSMRTLALYLFLGKSVKQSRVAVGYSRFNVSAGIKFD